MSGRVITGLCVAAVALPVGAWRLERLGEGAEVVEATERVRIEGVVTQPPRRFGDGTLLVVETSRGRIAVRTGPGAPPSETGSALIAHGRLQPATAWASAYLRRLGVQGWLVAEHLRIAAPARAGLAGLLDDVRRRSGSAIDDSMPQREAALMRGFVLGDDSRIEPGVAEDFKRSGLAHLLAVSGQNVVLLLAFATSILIVLGVPIAFRWPLLIAAVALYVPIAGAGPSIQRAGVMGIIGLLAASLERPADRWWALYLAVVATLAWNPLSVTDVGWQLSFAAVAGIALLARPLASWLDPRRGGARGGIRAGLADGAAITVAATLATAPLMSLHFGELSLAALPANILALPAVAPAMWAGMAIALLGQLPGLPLGPVGALAALFTGYIEWIAHLFAEASWAMAELSLESWWSMLCVYIALSGVLLWVAGLGDRARGLRLPSRLRVALLAAAIALAMVLLVSGERPGQDEIRAGAERAAWKFEVRFLDVGQGDSILLRERDGPAVLVDTGYAGTGAEDRLRELGVERLEALVITHADADHAGNLEAISTALPIGTVFTNGSDRPLTGRIGALGLRHGLLAAGDAPRIGGIHLDVVWPPPEPAMAGGEPNAGGIVMIASWRGFSSLLTGDAEAEAAPYPATDVDLLKVAHHGSDDDGLRDLLARSRPEVAVISVGSENTYGHPTAATVAAVTEAGVPLLRTDADGEVRIGVSGRAWMVG